MKKLILAAFIGGLMAVALNWILTPKYQAVNAPTNAQTAFAHVIASRTLRCAYAASDPFLIVDPATGGKSGIFYDVLEEAGKRLNVKIEWSEEVGYGNINTGFIAGRYDAFCAGLWPAGTRATSTIFSHAIVWDPVSVWVRGDDARFDGHMSMLNDPAYKIADTDGDATVAMADALFPKAGRVTMSQNQTIAEEIGQVTSGKADAMFRDYLTIDRFEQGNAEKFKNLSPDKPALIYAATIGYNQGETSLRDMVDVVLDDMDRDGTIAGIVKKYLGDKSNLVYQRVYQYQPY